ncbi:bifunctional diaminohydroxyphosphoribosylaminopyrimidine deaminase/5-amino-6-(5-phosphoribosylamino)uracil reductase RibD [Butyricicoccus faecihominis]|uniref:bifunctional diaminohydroxyphosphoribosylaminopyrimidine deaminase/5-amino-6-(5-phosphoribosylamino)uracil reductase RibD n=1 Tax=Butyricicoccus faecihominis TaxID=1712515 RepID=UPI00247AADCA|nr:bifunctional diaminohydroxyphosphoribosylaminopyrimidine deaminase/5-amino-6-(5-phosphoribosylamino)uracil reductase RibD [Butyricicoccus faecihominis]MCQ5128077.1 bifunctional diaminohydroxyphosphoribosylaminopyrimidine deaminase/5-amino-6-(5-phosphoribosylamino)uracil reductase RibD [Butyricicoccus faecihominis]
MTDEDYMRRALMLARRGEGRVSPNPMVGCVIVKEGRVIGEGWHEKCGGPHAERAALAACAESPQGGTLYVTLEPCCHWGRTPPCTDAIMEKRLARVVVGCLDANPLVAGNGVQTLRTAGVAVATGVLEADCKKLNEVFFHFIQNQTPFVTLKYAMTLDGKLAAHTGDSKWVTGETARAHVHRTRNRLSAIMVGLGTVLQDDPLLTCRMEGGRDPVRIVCDSRLRIPPDCRLVRSARVSPLLIAAAERNARAEALERAGAEILLCNTVNGRIDLADLMRRLGARGIDSVLLEGGAALHFAALEAGIVHKVQAYIAPKLIGGAGAKSPVGGQGFAKMADALPLRHMTVSPLGENFLLEGELACSPVS